MPPKGWTLDDLAKELGIEKNAVAQRLHVKGIDPIFRGAIYPPDALDRIREAPMGRPPKAKSEEPGKPVKKPKK